MGHTHTANALVRAIKKELHICFHSGSNEFLSQCMYSKHNNPRHFFYLEGFWGQPHGPNFPSPRATMLLALRQDCSTAAITTPQKVLPI